MKYFLIAVMTVGLSGVAYADGHGDKGHDGKSSMDKVSKRLELNEDQELAVKRLYEQYRADKQALREQYHEDMSEVLNAKQMEKYLKMKKKRKHNKVKNKDDS
jgi:Spy/CpxP family protein refolding chaperone